MGAVINQVSGSTQVDAEGYAHEHRRLDEPEPLVGRFAVSVYPGSPNDVVLDLKRFRKVRPVDGGGDILVRQAAVSMTREDAASLMRGIARALGMGTDDVTLAATLVGVEPGLLAWFLDGDGVTER